MRFPCSICANPLTVVDVLMYSAGETKTSRQDIVRHVERLTNIAKKQESAGGMGG
jgi:hypothetical protein